MTEPVSIPGLPAALSWSGDAADWTFDDAAEALTAGAGPGTDLFIDPGDGTRTLNAPRLTAPIAGDFQLSAWVQVNFGAVFDAGVLLLHADDQHWAKLCFEYSPQQDPMVVSVVTRGRSDDANAFTVDEDSVRLRVSRIGTAYAFHASAADDPGWRLIRHFDLDTAAPVAVGFEAQSPTGPGCTVTFSEIAFTRDHLTDLRDGS